MMIISPLSTGNLQKIPVSFFVAVHLGLEAISTRRV